MSYIKRRFTRAFRAANPLHTFTIAKRRTVPALWETCAWPVGKLRLSTGCVQVFHGAAFA